ncbi:MAG TPA: iron-sulfur cluster assembly scaffold protein [Terriglobales bacterium]|jgi:nitrogen fixation NifU-like protein|nr:iron-sulfur cluster assembly scaffold protein [Terriglobales bacterium]
MYSPQVLDHFQNPRNVGEVANPDVKVRIENPACGDILELTAKMDGGKFSEVRFRAKGCVSAMACSSLLTEMTVGKTLEDAKTTSKEGLVREIGGLLPASGHAAQLAMDGLHALLEEATRGK